MEDYITDNTFEAAVFMSLGHTLREINASEPRIRYIFEKTEQFNQDLSDYITGRLAVEPSALKGKMDLLHENVYKLRPKT